MPYILPSFLFKGPHYFSSLLSMGPTSFIPLHICLLYSIQPILKTYQPLWLWPCGDSSVSCTSLIIHPYLRLLPMTPHPPFWDSRFIKS